MTSEIVILTPSAVTLAADSAVTIGNRNTYNGVNKLFMLSNDPPMGIMTYNLANFSNIPLETIIKEFRREIKNEGLSTVEEFRDRFKEFLGKLIDNPLHSCSFEENLIDFISLFKLNQFNINETQFENIIRSISSEWDYDSLGENSKILIEKLSEHEETFIEVIPNYENLDNPNEILKLFKKFFAYNKFSATTGVVIAGFNKDRLFPSYVEFKISYLFDDIFTFKEEDYMNLIGNDVLVKPLAQDDVIDTFLGNMDKRTRNMLTGYVNSIHEMYGVYLKEAITNNSNLTEEEKQKFVNEISKIESANDLLNNSFEEFLNQLKDKHANPILKSISALPKEELSNLAESLIKITSLKRKVQPDLDTVGGPVDVAIITRGEGFIWTKRKHYFDGELNPQFFERE